jgi:hypothetical protein
VKYLLLLLLATSPLAGTAYKADFFQNKEGNVIVFISDAHLDAEGGAHSKKQHNDFVQEAARLKTFNIIEDSGGGAMDIFHLKMPSALIKKIHDLDIRSYGLDSGVTTFRKELVALLDAHSFDDIDSLVAEARKKNLITFGSTRYDTALADLESHLSVKDIPLFNVESIRPGIELYQDDWTIGDALKLRNALIDNIESWKADPDALQKFYSYAISEYRNHPVTKFLNKKYRVYSRKITSKRSPSFYKTVDDSEFPVDPVDGIKTLDSFDSSLFDAVVLHMLYKYRKHPIIVVYLGGNHITELLEETHNILEQLGYTHKKTMGFADALEEDPLASEEDPNAVSFDTYFIPVLDLKKVFAYAEELSKQGISKEETKEPTHSSSRSTSSPKPALPAPATAPTPSSAPSSAPTSTESESESKLEAAPFK